MTALRYDPYLWVHLAGLATVPLWLVLCLLGFGVDYPTLPALELPLVLGLGVLPVLYMQLRRPFCIFCLVLLALKPAAIAEDQRRLLTVFRSWRVRLAAPFVALLLGWGVLQLYQAAPVVADITPFHAWGRLGGLAIATVGVMGASLFLQVPISVLLVLLTPAAKLQTTQPYPEQAISRDFSSFGLPVNGILPAVTPPAGGSRPQSLRPNTEAAKAGPNPKGAAKTDGLSTPMSEPASGVQGA